MMPNPARLFMQDALRAFLCVSLVFSSTGWSAQPTGSQRAARAGDIYTGAVSPENSNVYYDGGTEGGKAKVWSYIEAKGNTPAQYRFGVIEADGKVTWQSFQTAQPAKPTNLPLQTAPAPSENGAVKRPTTQAAQNSKADPFLKGKVVQGAKSLDGGEVYYDGTIDPAGRQVVWSYRAENASYRFGVLNNDGKIQWFNESGEAISADADPEWRPSRLQERLNWTGEKARQLSESIRRIIRGEAKPVEIAKNPRSYQEYLRDVDKIPQTTGGAIGGTMVTFYIGMGMISALILITDYPNNPLVLEKYMEKLTDPVGWMMLAGFLMVAYPYISKVNGLSTGKQVVRAVPYFAAGLLAGAVLQGMMTYAMDKDVRKCLGLASRDMLFQRDMAACDAAYDKLTAEKISLAFVPAIAGLMAAAGTYLGLNYVSNVVGLTRVLRSLPVMKGPKAGAIGMIFTGVVFLGAYEFSDRVFKLEKKTRDFLLAEQSLGVNAYGASIADAEKNLYKGYAELRTNNWIDRTAEDTKAECPQAVGDQLTLDCGNPPDFKGVLDRYGALQEAWRANQMATTLESYNQWVTKVESYHKLLNSSFNAYQEFMDHIQFDVMNPGASDTDARGFNPTTIRNLEKERTVTGQDPTMNQNFSGTWRYINTQKFYDFIVTSMACGPEGEAKVERGIWQKTKDFGAKWITRNTTPKEVINDTHGFSVEFVPPKIVQPMASNQFESVCEYPVGHPLPPKPAILDPAPNKATPENFIVAPGLFASGKTYKGLYDYIKDNIRPSIMENGNNQFIRWWVQNVMTQVAKAEMSFRDEFQDMLMSKYKPAMTNPDYYWCEKDGGLTDIGLNAYLRRLTPQGNPGCPIDWRSRLARGIMNSLTDEARLYIAMAIDVHMSSHKNAPPEKYKRMEDELLQAGTELAVLLDVLVKRMTVIDQDQRGDINSVSDAAGNAFVKFAALMPPHKHWVRPHAVTPQLQWEAILLNKIQNVVQSTSNYYNILHTFEAEKAKAAPQVQPPSSSDRAEQQDEAQPSGEDKHAMANDANQADSEAE